MAEERELWMAVPSPSGSRAPLTVVRSGGTELYILSKKNVVHGLKVHIISLNYSVRAQNCSPHI